MLQRENELAAAYVYRFVESDCTVPLTLSCGSMNMIERRIDLENDDIYLIVGNEVVHCLVFLAPCNIYTSRTARYKHLKQQVDSAFGLMRGPHWERSKLYVLFAHKFAHAFVVDTCIEYQCQNTIIHNRGTVRMTKKHLVSLVTRTLASTVTEMLFSLLRA